MPWDSIGIQHVYMAKNGEKAKQIMLEHPIDILLCDVRMPGVSGLELIVWIETSSYSMEIIMISGFAEFKYVKEAMEHGASGYILKSLSPDELMDKVKKSKETLLKKRYLEKATKKYEQDNCESEINTQILSCFSNCNEQTTEIIHYIITHYNEELSLVILAEHYHFSITHISRMIKKETQHSFIDILTSIRLIHALSLLQEFHTHVSTACELAGFKDQRYFSQVFENIMHWN